MLTYAVIALFGMVMVLGYRVIQLEKQVDNIDGDVEQLFNESEEQFVFHIEGDDNNVIN